MSLRKTKTSAIYGSTTLIAVLFVLVFLATPNASATGKDTPATAADYRTKCALCHGPDGAGSTVGKSMKVPDLRSQAVQKKPDSELAAIISNGKGAMPSFKSSLSEGQIQALVAHIRAMGTKK